MAGSPSFFGLSRRSFWLFFGGIWLGAGLIMLVVAAGMAVRESQFAGGATAGGIVATKDIIPADSDSSTEYRVTYRFTTPDGRTVEGSDAVSVETWESLEERGPIEVRYLVGDPGQNRLSPGGEPLLVAIFGLFGLVFGGIGGFLVVRSIRGIRRAQRLLAVGIPTRATVVSVEMTNVQVNRRNQFEVHYTYRAGGAEQSGRSGHLDWEVASQWGPGDTVEIRVDPADPAQSYWSAEAVGSGAGGVDAPVTRVDAPGPSPTVVPIVDAPPPESDAPRPRGSTPAG